MDQAVHTPSGQLMLAQEAVSTVSNPNAFHCPDCHVPLKCINLLSNPLDWRVAPHFSARHMGTGRHAEGCALESAYNLRKSLYAADGSPTAATITLRRPTRYKGKGQRAPIGPRKRAEGTNTTRRENIFHLPVEQLDAVRQHPGLTFKTPHGVLQATQFLGRPGHFAAPPDVAVLYGQAEARRVQGGIQLTFRQGCGGYRLQAYINDDTAAMGTDGMHLKRLNTVVPATGMAVVQTAVWVEKRQVKPKRGNLGWYRAVRAAVRPSQGQQLALGL